MAGRRAPWAARFLDRAGVGDPKGDRTGRRGEGLPRGGRGVPGRWRCPAWPTLRKGGALHEGLFRPPCCVGRRGTARTQYHHSYKKGVHA